jgi:trans-2,3-dihydro-3-hydroxyanthranilate isomerase
LPVPRTLQYRQVDVFTDRPLSGNALAVFLDGRGLEARVMQAIARELNLPETAFLLPPSVDDATYCIRTFTPVEETFSAAQAYHGTAFVLAEEALIPLDEPLTTLWQETQIGVVSPIEVEVAGGRPVKVSVMADAPVFGRVFGRPGSPVLAALALALGVDPDDLTSRGLFPQIVSTRDPYFIVCLENLDRLSGVEPDFAALRRIGEQLDVTGFSVFAPHARDLRAQVHVRFFSCSNGGVEEPASAGAAAALGAYLANRQIIRPDTAGPARFTIEQGVEMLRPSYIEVSVAVDSLDLQSYTVRVSGACATVASGELLLP